MTVSDGRTHMDEPLKTFLKVLDSENTSVGGGSASAMAGAMAAALVAMVARLSVGKDGMREDAFYNAILGEAEVLSSELYNGALDDEKAFAAIRTAYRLPKDTTSEKNGAPRGDPESDAAGSASSAAQRGTVPACAGVVH